MVALLRRGMVQSSAGPEGHRLQVTTWLDRTPREKDQSDESTHLESVRIAGWMTKEP